MNKPPKIVIAPEGRFHSLTAGKEYQVIKSNDDECYEFGYSFWINSDIEHNICCVEKYCPRINRLDWIIKERQSSTVSYLNKLTPNNLTMNETITIKGVEFDVQFNYTPEEPEVRYDKDMAGHPGSASEIEILEVQYKGTCFLEFFDGNLTEVESAVELWMSRQD